MRPPLRDGKMVVTPAETPKLPGGNKKSGKQAAAVEEVPHSYLVSMVAKELWEIKRFLRPSGGLVSDYLAYQV